MPLFKAGVYVHSGLESPQSLTLIGEETLHLMPLFKAGVYVHSGLESPQSLTLIGEETFFMRKEENNGK
ncbi:hypothetical protein FOG27_04205 [Staphylococcus delphini]|nr:hypothetical protein [Staphylococcus delphini]